jgi:hypothetical protein
MRLRKRICREWWWTLNWVISGAVGILMKYVGHMGLVFGNLLGGVGRNFRGFLDFRWVII